MRILALALPALAAAQHADLVRLSRDRTDARVGAGRRSRLQPRARQVQLKGGEADRYLGLPEDADAGRRLEGHVGGSMGSMPAEAEADVMCSFCPDGVADPDFVLPTADGATCGTAKAFADTLPESDVMCSTVKLAEALCCPPTPATLPATADDTTTASCKSIVEIAAGDENFSTLVAAVTAAGLVDALSGEGPLTVFAPTDAAFTALPEGTVESLLGDPAALGEVLKYHVVAAEALSSSLVSGDVETLSGDTVAVTVSDDGGVMVNDANVVAADIIACNGVIHVIDKVLLPPAEETPATLPVMPETTAAATEAPETTDEPTEPVDITIFTEAPETEEPAVPATLPATPEETEEPAVPATLPATTDDGWSGSADHGFGAKSAKGTKSAKGEAKAKTQKNPMAKTHKEASADESSSDDSKSGKALVDVDAKAKKVSGEPKSKAGKLMKGDMSYHSKSSKAATAKTMKPEGAKPEEAVDGSWSGSRRY